MAKKQAKKQFAVIGLGRFGMALTKTLFKEGADVLAIDIDPERVNAADSFCTQAICADASDEHVLKKLALNNLDVVINCTASSIEASIFVTLMCKQMGIKQVIAKAKSEMHKQVLEKIGADMVIFPEEALGEKLGAMLVKPNMIEVLSLTDDFRIVEIKTPVKWQNKTLQKLDLRTSERVTVVLVKRNEEVIVTPAGNFTLLKDDILVIAGSIEATDRLSSKATQDVLDVEDVQAIFEENN